MASVQVRVQGVHRSGLGLPPPHDGRGGIADGSIPDGRNDNSGAARVQAARLHIGTDAHGKQPPTGHERGSVQT